MSPTPQTSYKVCNKSTTQRTKKTIEKCLLTYFAVSKFVLYEEIELTCMICLYVTRLNLVKRDFSCVVLVDSCM